ncbi:hypothetical protein QCA50_003197 [Cerrena zonata]|uniref:DUF4246 domain-containing protein n=1 Tax=Cerrena zonata TaxID=2478898 RepID=A0AAW0GIZ4_9APHY
MILDSNETRRLREFCDAVRAKPDWALKILDSERGLAEKWAREAGLYPVEKTEEPETKRKGKPKKSDTRTHVPVEAIEETLDDLKSEARRLRTLDYTLRLTSPQISAREVDWQKIDADVFKMWKFANGSLGSMYPMDWFPNLFIPNWLRHLMNLPAVEPKDFHPETGRKVQDLIHPSLYPYTVGITEILPGVEPPRLNDKGKFHITMTTNAEWYKSETFESTQSWIPSIFAVNEDATEARIEGYINGLGQREHFPDLYRLVEKVFVLCLPHFGKTLEDGNKFEDADLTPSEKRWEERSDAREDGDMLKSEWKQMLQESHAERAKEDEAHKAKIKEVQEIVIKEWNQFASGNDAGLKQNTKYCDRFKNQKLKVIVKAANYILKPGQEYEGSWHMEGMPHERVVASAIYYYSADPSLSDEGLGIRRFRNPNGFPNEEEHNIDNFIVSPKQSNEDEDDEDEDGDDDEDGGDDDNVKWDYPSDWELDEDEGFELHNFVPVGTVATTNSEDIVPVGHQTGRIVSFPNFVQHKVLKLKNEGPETAVRKILCFFLVEDNDEHLKTSDYDKSVEWPGFSFKGLMGHKVLTTSEIPIQAQQTNFPTLRFLLSVASQRATGKALAGELIDLILNSENFGVTAGQAEGLRRSFMDERRPKPHDGSLWEEEYSLCEH